MVEKLQKVEKWKTIKVPENVWHVVKVEAAEHNLKLYEELAVKYGLLL